jgi:hypothetical protein
LITHQQNLTGSAADVVLGQAGFTVNTSGTTVNKMKGPVGIYVDGNDRLWITDRLNHRVLRFDNASTLTNGANADFVLGPTRILILEQAAYLQPR